QVLPKDWSEKELLRHVLRGEQPAWQELVRRYRSLIYRCITKVMGRYESVISSADPDEVFSEVLVSLLRDDMRKLRLYDSRRGSKLSSWLGLIATNTSYDFLRGTARRPILDRIDGFADVLDSHEQDALDDLIEKERRAHLNTLLAEFSEKDRTFVL